MSADEAWHHRSIHDTQPVYSFHLQLGIDGGRGIVLCSHPHRADLMKNGGGITPDMGGQFSVGGGDRWEHRLGPRSQNGRSSDTMGDAQAGH